MLSSSGLLEDLIDDEALLSKRADSIYNFLSLKMKRSMF